MAMSSAKRNQRLLTGAGTAGCATWACTTATVTVLEQCAAAGQVGSPPPLAVAVLLPLAAAALTLTFSVSNVLADGASVPVNVQLRLLVPVHVQLAPLALAKVMPAGRTSLSVMLPNVAAEPLLTIVTA